MGTRKSAIIVLLLVAVVTVSRLNACGTGGVSVDFHASASNHRIQVKSIGQDLQFLMVHGSGYQVARVPDVSVSLVDQSSTSAMMRADDGTTLSLSVVTDTASLYLVKVTWANVKKELWDCKQLSE